MNASRELFRSNHHSSLYGVSAVMENIISIATQAVAKI